MTVKCRIQQNERLSMHDALKTIGTAIKKLEADGTQQGLDSVQMSRKMIEFGAQFITKYPGLASQLTGRIGELFYTPNVCKIFKDNAAEVREKIPKAARPLTFEFNQKDANDYLKKGKEKKIKKTTNILFINTNDTPLFIFVNRIFICYVN